MVTLIAWAKSWCSRRRCPHKRAHFATDNPRFKNQGAYTTFNYYLQSAINPLSVIDANERKLQQRATTLPEDPMGKGMAPFRFGQVRSSGGDRSKGGSGPTPVGRHGSLTSDVEH